VLVAVALQLLGLVAVVVGVSAFAGWPFGAVTFGVVLFAAGFDHERRS
jgi:hypothetical protein